MENKQPIERGGIVVREVGSEILVFLDHNFPTRLSAIQEAAKILQREALREQLRQQDETNNARRDDRVDYQEKHNDGFENEF